MLTSFLKGRNFTRTKKLKTKNIEQTQKNKLNLGYLKLKKNYCFFFSKRKNLDNMKFSFHLNSLICYLEVKEISVEVLKQLHFTKVSAKTASISMSGITGKSFR